MKIEFPNDFSIEKLHNKFLWKYLDLFKLIDILNNKEVHFGRFDHFEDGLEGITGKGISLKALTQREPLTEENINKGLDNHSQGKIIANDKNIRDEYTYGLEISQQTQFASCWFLGDRESMAMWKLYSRTDGIALKFNAQQLVTTVIASAESMTNTDFHLLYFGLVDYKKLWPFDFNEIFQGNFNGLKKDISYIHENEFRFVAVTPKSKKGFYRHFKLPIGDLSFFDLEIITNPFLKAWQFDNLKNLLQKYNLDDRLKKSKMEINKQLV